MAAMTTRFPDALSLLREMREMMDLLREGGPLAPFFASRSTTSQCPINVFEDQDAYYVQALLPGINPDEVQIHAFEGSITIAGEAKVTAPEHARAIWQEFQPFRFQRSIQLGTPFDLEKVQASYRNGVLTLTVPKAEAAKPKLIKVQTNNAQ